jgi:hypothetical protein
MVVVATLMGRVKVAADEVVLTDDAAAAAREAAERRQQGQLAGEGNSAQGRRDSAYADLMLRVDEALSALQTN